MTPMALIAWSLAVLIGLFLVLLMLVLVFAMKNVIVALFLPPAKAAKRVK